MTLVPQIDRQDKSEGHCWNGVEEAVSVSHFLSILLPAEIIILYSVSLFWNSLFFI